MAFSVDIATQNLGPVPPSVPVAGVSVTPGIVPQGVDSQGLSDAVGNVFNGGTFDGLSFSYSAVTKNMDATNTDKGSVAVTAHEAAGDPHPQYTTDAEVNALIAAASITGPEVSVEYALTVDQTISEDTATLLDLDDPVVTHADFSSDGAGTFTVAVAGLYGVDVSVVLETGGTSALLSATIGLFRNTTLVAVADCGDVPISTQRVINLSTQVICAASDDLSVKIITNNVSGAGTADVLATADAVGETGVVLTGIKIVRQEVGPALSGGGGGVTDHGALTGLGDDDHTQYHNDARGDARYSLLGHTHPEEWAYLYLGSDHSNSTTTASDIPTIQLTFPNAGRFVIEFLLLAQTTNVTTMPRFTVSEPNNSNGAWLLYTTHAATTTLTATGGTGATPGVTAGGTARSANLPLLVEGKAYYIATATATLAWKLRLSSETGGVSVSVLAGSFIRWRQLP